MNKVNIKQLLCGATLGLMALMPVAADGREVSVASPDGHITVTINDEGGRATYAVSLDGRAMLLPSALGFTADFGDFTQGLRITDSHAGRVDTTYQMRQVKQSAIRYEAMRLTVDFQNGKEQKMAVEFSVSNRDVAFRYLLFRQKNDNPKCAVVKSEASAFRLPEGTTTFLTPQSKEMVGWERTKPSYEEEYQADAPMTDRSRFGEGYTFPCLFRTGSDGWVLISETGVSSQYCGSHLSDYDAARGYTIAFPMAGENNGRGDTFAGIALPGATPWRTITLGQTLKPIVETTVAYDLVEPLYEASEEYQPGRYTWSWLIWQDNSINWDDQLEFVNLAANMGYEYCLVDNWWDEKIGRERMAKLSAYAQALDVHLMLWYNSNGFENDAPQTPRDRMNTAMARDKEMAWLQQIGVKGIKVDFFGGDKQETMKLYEDILYDANRYGLQVIFHGCTLPRGWERMYPNYVASEAVLASENVYFSDHHAKQEPFELTMHPFCRNAFASMDWGGVIMNRYLSKDNRSRHQRQTTNVFEMATAITNQTAIQCIAMQPNNLENDELTFDELQLLRELPTTWDETRFIDGYPGRYVVLARRHGDKWYVAGLNATDKPIKMTVDLSEMGNGQPVYYTDSKKGTEVKKFGGAKVRKDGSMKVEMQPNGGFVVVK